MPIQIPNGPKIYSRDELVNMGYVGYRGWSDPGAGLDFQATKGTGKGGVEMKTGSTGVPSFNFNYESELEKAYGELGKYYDRILTESRGDLNKALSRMVEDYDRGLRFSREDTQENLVTAGRQAMESALSRGLYQKSNVDPAAGMGLADQMQERAKEPILEAQARNEEVDLLNKTRSEVDLNEEQRRREFELEQRRRREAAELTNSREGRAYTKFASSLT